jgi:hypothetical protein
MHVLIDKAHDKAKFFYREEEKVKSERGMNGREGGTERERKGQKCVR